MDYIVTVRIKNYEDRTHKSMRERLEHYLNYWVEDFGTGTSATVLRVVKKKKGGS